MRRCQANLPNRCRRQIDRIAHRAFDGEQWMNREGRAATTGNTYCGNLLWQSGLTLLAPARIESMLANGSDTPFTWSYYPGSDLKSSLAYPNGLTASWQYDAKGQLLQVCNATPTKVISQYDYTYDAAGRRIEVSKSGSVFAQDDTLSYGYNNRSELTNAVAMADSDYRYAYDFDDIGNRETSSERGTNSVYAANNLNQYITISNFVSSVSFVANEFAPQFDDDGNQTLIKTATGIWQVQYNGENRPILWECVTPDSNTSNSNTQIGKKGQTLLYKLYCICLTVGCGIW